MEAVRAFNNELSSLYESKPPVSRAKMAQVTKFAIKAIKFYKHVVQSVEKFIQKCKPEYKVPGLYVIDSIVRQSRHQFGPEKDVFSPRFTKNIVTTFTHLFKCAEEERSRVVRVLNLWQKNSVFSMEIIQPLLDLAADPDSTELISAAQAAVDSVVSSSQKIPLPVAQPSSNGGDSNSSTQILQQTEMLSTITKLLKQAQEVNITNTAPETQLQKLQHLQQQLVMQTERISQPQQQSAPPIDNNLLAQIQMLTNQLLSKPGGGGPKVVENTNNQNSVEPLFNKKLLEFDYGDSDEDDDKEDHQQQHFQQHQQQRQPVEVPQQVIPKVLPDQNILPKAVPDQNILSKLISDQIILPKLISDQIILPKVIPDQIILPKVIPDQIILPKVIPDQIILPKVIPDQIILPKAISDQIILPKVVPDQNILPKAIPDQNILHQIQQMSQQQEQLQSEIGAQDQLRRRLLEQQQQQFDREIEQESLVSHRPTQGFNQDQDRRPDIDHDDRENHDRSSHRRQRESRDRSRSPRRRSRRSRSRSRDRDRDRRRRSRSRDRYRRSRSRDRERREKERERRKMGLPPLKSNNIAICSTTIWFGRLTKHTTEEELREHIEKYGTIRTINMVPPRGCAFVCVTKRKDAAKVMDRLKGIKINGNTIKVAWAPGIGVKESVFKDLWDVDQGVTYIPWDQLPKDVVPLLAGGMVDEESLPERLKGMKTGEEDEIEPQQNPSNKNEVPHEDSVKSQQLPSQVPLGMPGLPNFPLPGQASMALMGPGGPLSLLSGPPPPIGIPPGIGTPLGLGGASNIVSQNTVLGHNSVGLSNNMNTLSSMGNLNINALTGLVGPLPNLPGMGPSLPGALSNLTRAGPNLPATVPNLPGSVPNLPGMGPRPMNLGPSQGSMMGGQGNSISGIGGANVDTLPSPAGVNSPGPRPFGQFGSIPRFPQMQGRGGIHSFVNSGSHPSEPGMGDSDMRPIAEPKEWPPDDEVNAEDESDDDHPMDSDERVLPLGRQQHMPGPGMPNLQALGTPFGLRGPILPGQRPLNTMIGIPQAPNPTTGIPSLISLRMMPPVQQPPIIAISGGSAPGFALAPSSVRLSVPTIGVGQSILPAATSPHLIPPSTGSPLTVAVSVNGSMVVTRPGLPTSNAPLNTGAGENPATSTKGSSSEEDKLPHTPSLVPVMQIRPPSGPILGRGFAPMTIRPRSGPGLLGLRPGAHGGSGFNRFGGSRPLIGPAFGEMDRPPFGNRFGVPLRPPVGFLDQDEREDRDERRPLPRIDDDQPVVGSGVDQSVPKDIDERRDSAEGKDRSQDIDMRQDIDERPKPGRASGRPSRWCSGSGPEEASKSTLATALNTESKATDDASSGSVTESAMISTPSVAGVPSAADLTKKDSVPVVTDVSAATKTSVLGDEGEVTESS